MKNIYLIVGPSGVGKTTLVEKLAKDYGYKTVESYTTRQPRYSGETGHIFVSDEEFDRLGEMVAYTQFNGYRYGVTAEIIDANDLYVIDPYGVQYMLDRYKGRKGVVVIGLVADRDELRARMRARGDSKEKVEERIQHDARAFDYSRYNIRFDLMVHADGVAETEKAVSEYIRFRERYDCNVHIYQINPDRDVNRVNFASADLLLRFNGGINAVDRSIYDEVYAGDVEFKSLEDIFRKFNQDDRPNAQDMHSLSVSDVVEIRHNDDADLNGYWFCDSFGWKKLDDEWHFAEEE